MRDPTEEELADELECEVDEVREPPRRDRRDVDRRPRGPAHRHERATATACRVLDTLPDLGVEQPGEAIEATETRQALRQAIEDLGERDRKVVVLYYLEGFTLARIGDILGVTESRVSQIHSQGRDGAARPHGRAPERPSGPSWLALKRRW